jgi:hypothetical protein
MAFLDLPATRERFPTPFLELPSAPERFPTAFLELPSARERFPTASLELPRAPERFPTASLELPRAPERFPTAFLELPATRERFPTAWEALTGGSSLFTRYGIISRVHGDVVRREVKRMRATELAVIGDLDPLDLTVLLSLAWGGVGEDRTTRSIPVLWRGVRDDWRAECDRARRRTGYRSEPTIPMTDFEQKHSGGLEAVPEPQIVTLHAPHVGQQGHAAIVFWLCKRRRVGGAGDRLGRA